MFPPSEEAMRKAGTAHTKSSNDMENHIYVKAKSRVSTAWLQETCFQGLVMNGRITT